MQLADSYTGEFFHLTDDGHGGTMVTEDNVPCYCRGTMILTDRGEIAVEDLKIGDRLITASGKARPIRWIGTRSYSGQFASGNKQILPVQIKQGALGDNLPRRDLWVSPQHAMFLDGVLIPASTLVNEASIVRAKRVDRVEYFHLELDTHDVIVAEGALSESFLDDGSRGMFLNAASYREIYPDAAPPPARYCAPRVEDGRGIADGTRPDRGTARRQGRLTVYGSVGILQQVRCLPPYTSQNYSICYTITSIIDRFLFREIQFPCNTALRGGP